MLKATTGATVSHVHPTGAHGATTYKALSSFFTTVVRLPEHPLGAK